MIIINIHYNQNRNVSLIEDAPPYVQEGIQAYSISIFYLENA